MQSLRINSFNHQFLKTPSKSAFNCFPIGAAVKEKKLKLDEIDRKIVQALQSNGRAAYKTIARQLKVSDGTVRFRTERMIRQNFLKISASVNPLYFDDAIAAQVGVNLEKRANREIMEAIAALDGVQSVVNVTGRYDLVIEVCATSRDALRRFLVDDLSTVPGISSSESFIYLDAINKWVKMDRRRC